MKYPSENLIRVLTNYFNSSKSKLNTDYQSIYKVEFDFMGGEFSEDGEAGDLKLIVIKIFVDEEDLQSPFPYSTFLRPWAKEYISEEFKLFGITGGDVTMVVLIYIPEEYWEQLIVIRPDLEARYGRAKSEPGWKLWDTEFTSGDFL